MKTAFFAIDNISKRLISLGEGDNNDATAQMLVDNAESVAKFNHEPLSFDGRTVLTLNDLYRLSVEAQKAINAYPPDAFEEGESEVEI